MNKYEAVFILDPKKVDDGGDAFVAQATQRIEEQLGGKVAETTNMGRKHFARLVIELNADQVAVLQESYRLDSAVLRLQVFTYVAPPPPVAAAE
jgi:ribosomal protein S6